MKYKNILFDLDGTLTDPKVGITKSVQYALKRFDIVVKDLNQLDPFIGPPLANSFIDIYNFTESDAKMAVDYYREYFKEQGIFENVIYPGIVQLLEKLEAEGRTLMIATSKPTVFAERILDYFDISRFFSFVCGSNLDGSRSDKTEIIGYIFAEKHISKEGTVMIGDRKHDIIGARNNKIESIAVGYGYGSEEELRGSKPTKYIKKVEELYLAIS